MDNLIVSDDKKVYMTFNKSSLSMGLKSEPFHHTFSFGYSSKIVDYHLTDHPDKGVKRNRLCISYGTVTRLMVYVRSQQQMFIRSFLSGIRTKASMKWDNIVLISPNSAESLFDFPKKDKKFEMRDSYSEKEIFQLLHCSCVLENLSENEGFIAYKLKGSDLHFFGIVVGFAKVKGHPPSVLFISKRQMERWGNRFKEDVENIIKRDTTPERQNYLQAKVDATIASIKNLPQYS